MLAFCEGNDGLEAALLFHGVSTVVRFDERNGSAVAEVHSKINAHPMYWIGLSPSVWTSVSALRIHLPFKREAWPWVPWDG